MRTVVFVMVALAVLALFVSTGSVAAKGKPVASVTSIAIDVNPVAVGGAANITVTVAPVPASGGILFVEAAVDASGAPTSCEAAADFEDAAMLKPATGGTLTIPANTSAAGTFGYRGHFAPADSGVAQSKSDCVDLVVQ